MIFKKSHSKPMNQVSQVVPLAGQATCDNPALGEKTTCVTEAKPTLGPRLG